MTLDFLALPLILYVGLRTSWEDLRTGKIRNRLVLLLLMGFLVFHGIAALIWGLGGGWRSGAVNTLGLGTFCLHTLTNGLSAFVVSFMLWLFRFWAAGDAKLFSVLAFALPLGFYRNDYLDWFPGFVLLFNTFIGIFAWLVLEFVVRLGLRVIRGRKQLNPRAAIATATKGLRDNWKKYARAFVTLVAFFLTIRILRKLVRYGLDEVVVLNNTLMYAVLFLCMYPLARHFAHKYAFYVGLAVMSAYFVWSFGFSGETEDAIAILNVFQLSMLLIVLYGVYYLYTSRVDIRHMAVADIQPGQILSHRYVLTLQSNSDFNNERMGFVGPDGLTTEQVETLQTWHDLNHPEGRSAIIETCTTIPFAPGMLIGVILSAAIGGYLFEVSA